jgi:hypothetical protein
MEAKPVDEEDDRDAVALSGRAVAAALSSVRATGDGLVCKPSMIRA